MSNVVPFTKERLSLIEGKAFLDPFMRDEIQSGDIRHSLRELLHWIDNAETALAYQGRIHIAILGYDDDARELCEIPEVRQWFRRLTYQFPFWFHFCERRDDSLALVIQLLSIVRVERRVCNESVVIQFDSESGVGVMRELLAAVNTLYDELGIGEAAYRRTCAEVAAYFSNRFPSA